MAKRWLYIEDNEDGTCTLTVNFGEGEHGFVIPMRLEDLGALIPEDAHEEAQARVLERIVHIPDEIPEV